MKLSLLVLTTGKQEGKKLEIKVSPFLVGRDAQCHLRPASPLISKMHCAFSIREGKVYLKDFESTNGSVVNGQPILDEVELKDKDRIKIGPIEFQVQIEVPASVKSPEKVVEKPVKKTAEQSSSSVKKPKPMVAATATTNASGAGSQQGADETVQSDMTATRDDGGSSGDDDIAAMLLDMSDDTDSEAAALNSDGIPDGSTVMEMKVPDNLAEKKDGGQKAKEAQQNTSQAARDILSKYMRRPREG